MALIPRVVRVFNRMVFPLLATVFPLFSFAAADSVGSEKFMAGAGVAVVEVPNGNSLAGYFPRRRIWSRPQPNAHYFVASTGQHDPIRAKSLVLKTNDRTFVFVSLDLVGIFPQFRDEVLQRLTPIGIRSDDLLLAATHTHSAPGGFAKVALWEQLATDRFNPLIFKNIVDAIVSSVYKAYGALEPARLGIIQDELKGVSFNRRNSKSEEPVLTLMRVESKDKKAIASLFNFPVHGTVLGLDNLVVSGDLPGEIERDFEKKGNGITLFMSDAAGDIAPKAPAADFRAIEKLAAEIVKQASDVYDKVDTSDELEITTARASVKLANARLSLRNCISVFGKLGEFFYNTVLPPDFNKPMELRAIKLGSHLFMTVPAEPITELGNKAKALFKSAGFKSVSMITLADSYLGYILTAAEYKRGGYETCNSFYGEAYGDKFLEGTAALVVEMKK